MRRLTDISRDSISILLSVYHYPFVLVSFRFIYDATGVSRNEIVKKITLMGVNNFTEYEEEMRDFIRNDIIHPYRDRYKQKIAQPFLMADYVLEDLGFVDWLFKQILFNAIK